MRYFLPVLAAKPGMLVECDHGLAHCCLAGEIAAIEQDGNGALFIACRDAQYDPFLLCKTNNHYISDLFSNDETEYVGIRQHMPELNALLAEADTCARLIAYARDGSFTRGVLGTYGPGGYSHSQQRHNVIMHLAYALDEQHQRDIAYAADPVKTAGIYPPSHPTGIPNSTPAADAPLDIPPRPEPTDTFNPHGSGPEPIGPRETAPPSPADQARDALGDA